ncbi:MAG TPA: hypothetical protein VE053_09740 [Allosphingosinicella sp.]|nr:hypothetical protein [Allosphingosinicella sp.]
MPNSLDHYLVGLRRKDRSEAALLGFQQMVAGRDDARIVSARPGGPLVVQLSKQALEQLAEQFADDLIIEPDAPLIY